jgi:hypothetical protein
MRFPHRDNATPTISGRPHDDHHPVVQIANREKTILPLSVGWNGQRSTRKQLFRQRHVQAAGFEGGLALSWIEGYFH